MRLIRFFLLFSHVIIMGLLLMVLLNKVVPPSVFPYFNFLALAFPILMPIHVILLLFWAAKRKKKRVTFFIICSLPLINPTRRWVNFSFDKEGKENMTLLTFNIKNGYGRSNDKVDSLESSSHYDLLLFQEAGYKQLQLKKPYLFSETESEIVNSFSRFPIEKHEIIIKPGEQNKGSANFIDVNINGKKIRVINIYLNSFFVLKDMVKPSDELTENEQKYKRLIRLMTKNFKTHEEEIKTILPYIKNSPYPVIVTGDFNSVPNSYEYFQFNKLLKDTFVESGNGSATSFHDFKFPIRIDYVWVSKDIKSSSYKVDRTVKFSDHYPVVVQLEIPKK